MGPRWQIRSRTSRAIRLGIRLLFYTFLLSLPITIFPVSWGIQGGVHFHFWSHRRIAENTNAYLFDIERHGSLSYWNVPGAQTIHEFQDSKGPFCRPSLRLLDWTKKLSVLKPDSEAEGDPGIDRTASLDDLVRRSVSSPRRMPESYWVYVTWLPEYSSNPWDTAFSELLQEMYVHPLDPSVEVYVLDCLASQFLCGVWGVKHPSLVHFQVGNETLAELEASGQHTPQLYYHYNHPFDMLYPVTARVIELPLEGDDAVHFLPRNTLPTPYLQLRTLLRDAPKSAITAHFDAWEELVQTLTRFQDVHDAQTERYGSLSYRVSKADSWYTDHVLKPIFGKDINEFLKDTQNLIFTVVMLCAALIRLPFQFAWSLYTQYAGLAWTGEPMGAHQYPIDEDGEYAGDTMMDDMMAAFWPFAAEKLHAASVEAAASAAVTEVA
jgi:hypothetical protein